ncbi:MAG: sulfite reductase [Waddliaceae bacterium]
MTKYNKDHPFLATIKKRYSLCSEGSKKHTHHIVLDLTGSGLTYEVGDCIAIFPVNDHQLVEKTLQAIGSTGKEVIQDKKTGENWILYDYLQKKANLREVTRSLVKEIINKDPLDEKKTRLEKHLQGGREKFQEIQSHFEVWDLLSEYPEATFSPQELSNLLLPLLPRFYSIASSYQEVGEEVHLTVVLQEYETRCTRRLGACSHYLCSLVPLEQSVVPIYIQPHNGFTIPEDLNAPMIMIGPGTGVAPFRGFLQERVAKGATGSHWLFFGEWHEKENFFYKEYWKELESLGKLRLDVAFSRDQEEKIYVQHRMKEHSKDLFNWLQSGAFLYVCGDAKRMAKDVEKTLLEIIQQEKGCDEQEARDYIKNLRRSGKYLRDVY